MKKVGIIMGSDSDLPIVEKAMHTLDQLEVPYEVHIFSAHRTPVQAKEFSENARANGFGAIIAAAGMAAHLAGAIAANTTRPVIGVPIKSGGLGGMDALLSTVQMPSGIPVATVAIDGAKNAAFLAARSTKSARAETTDEIAGCAAAILRGALEAAALNVLVNTKTMTDRSAADHLNARCFALLDQGRTDGERIFCAVRDQLV